MRVFPLVLLAGALGAVPAPAGTAADPTPAPASAPPVPTTGGRALRPPPEVEFADPATPSRPPLPPSAPWRDADWWLRAVADRQAGLPPPYLVPPATGEPPALLLARGIRVASRAVACRPDSAQAAGERLWRLAASWLPPAVRPWLRARERAEAYHAKMVREADLYHDTAFQEVLVTDAPALDGAR